MILNEPAKEKRSSRTIAKDNFPGNSGSSRTILITGSWGSSGTTHQPIGLRRQDQEGRSKTELKETDRLLTALSYIEMKSVAPGDIPIQSTACTVCKIQLYLLSIVSLCMILAIALLVSIILLGDLGNIWNNPVSYTHLTLPTTPYV